MASGATRVPAVPGFASGLDADIRQLHSDEYRNPGSVAPGPVLVVGAGTSGAEIALELARELTQSHPVFVAGRPTPHIPDAVFRLAGGLYWAFVNGVLTRATPIGRKVAGKFHSRGAPLIRISMKQVKAAGVQRLPRITAVADGQPIADGAAVPRPATVIWATEYRPGLDWIAGLPLDGNGLPVTRRGAVENMPGLFFVGMPFQYALTSQLLGGVGRDAGGMWQGGSPGLSESRTVKPRRSQPRVIARPEPATSWRYGRFRVSDSCPGDSQIALYS